MALRAGCNTGRRDREVGPGGDGDGPVREGRHQSRRCPGEQTAEELRVQSVAQDGPLQRAGLQDLLRCPMGQREGQVITSPREARVDDVLHAVSFCGLNRGTVPRHDDVILGISR